MTVLTDAVAWRAGRYIYCMSHSAHQVSGDIELLTADSEMLDTGRKCDWCGKKLPNRKVG